MRDAYEASRRCEAMLVVGTSGVVQPAASLPYVARDAGATVIDVNPDEDELSAMADIFLKGQGGSVLPGLIDMIRALR